MIIKKFRVKHLKVIYMSQVRKCFSKLVEYYISNKNRTCKKSLCRYHVVSSGKTMVYFMCMVIITT